MGCGSSQSAQVASKHPIDDSVRQRKVLSSTSTITHGAENIPKVSIRLPERNMVVLYPFEVGGISIPKGGFVRVGENGKGDQYWCEVVTNGGTVHIPETFLAAKGTVECHEWYYECLSKYEAEKMLTQPGIEPGTFMVHQKSHSEDYICTTITKEGIMRQYVIRSDRDKYFITRRKPFPSVEALIEAFTNLNEEDDIPFKLCNPLPRVCPVVYSHYQGSEYPIVIQTEKVVIGEKIGNSELWEGTFNENTVVIRTFNPAGIKKQDFSQSLIRLRYAYSRNLQLLIGYCCAEDRLMVVAEKFWRGNLKDYLKTEGDNLIESDLIKLCAQVANGMSALELASITHGALSAHNIMIGNDNRLKICDAGLLGYLPVKESFKRWTAPEVLRDSNNTSPKSDVWSFGILLTEVVTLGEDPYSDLLDIEVETRILEGHRMSMPVDCHAYLYVIMTECWNMKYRNRPTFESIVFRLDDFYIAAEHETNPRQSLYRYIK